MSGISEGFLDDRIFKEYIMPDDLALYEEVLKLHKD